MVPVDVRAEQAVPVALDGVPDEKVHGRVLQHVDEDAAVAAVEGASMWWRRSAGRGPPGRPGACGGGRGGEVLRGRRGTGGGRRGRRGRGATACRRGPRGRGAQARRAGGAMVRSCLPDAGWMGKGTTRVSETAAARVLDCYWVGLDHGHTDLCHAGWLSKNYLKMIGGCKILWRKNKNFWWWDCVIKVNFM
ncbi:hypothetical protein GQ55_2G017000 [Panicum hallii var. hallii]|uniref:Uncharacterized protein n=1 Tax=Panicum hallii var. hallii TaxID=1504633 RepID=A0A2T7EKH2_9POAL|nr:hypothetical protein GQ55_2G017000 [Panicum hallii var. hallii]